MLRDAKPESFQEVYQLLKQQDVDNRLSLVNDRTMELRIDEKYKITASDNLRETYMQIVLNDKQLTHWHPDYEETYQDFLDYMEGKCIPPTEEEIKKMSKYYLLEFLAFIFLPLFVILLLNYVILDTSDWSGFARLVLVIVSWLLSWSVIIVWDQKNNNK